MKIVDDEGYLFGWVNIIDALVILLIIAIVAASLSLAFSPTRNETQTKTQVIRFQTVPEPAYVVNAIPEGRVSTDTIVAVENKSIQKGPNETYVVLLRVRIVITQNDDGFPMFKNERLYIGRKMQLDFGTTIVDGVVVRMGPIQGTRS